jgi:TRAP-type C4-dicarboxylate transport system permease small subunit
VDARDSACGRPGHDDLFFDGRCERLTDVTLESKLDSRVRERWMPAVKTSYMDRFIDAIELVAAAFVGIVAADVFISVVLRKFFSVAIPDSYDFGRLLLGILIFWGIAATSYRGTHITVDLVWGAVDARSKRAIDVFATLTLLFVVTVQTWTLFDKVRTTYADNVMTYDLNLPTWPFFAVAWAGDVSAVLLIAVRAYRLIFQPRSMLEAAAVKPVE